jgi:hypothetical protein
MLKKFVAVTLVLVLLSVTCVTSFASSRNNAQTAGQSSDLLSLIASLDFQGIEDIGFTVRDLVYDNGLTSFSIDMTPDVVNSFTVSFISATETQIVVDEADSDGNTCTDTVLFVDGVLSAIDGMAAASMATIGYSQAFSSMGTQALPVWQYYDYPPGSTTSSSYNVLYNTYNNTVSTGQTAISNMTVAVFIGYLAGSFPIAVATAALSIAAQQIKSNIGPYAANVDYTANVYRIQGDLEIREKHSVTYYYPLANGSTASATIPFYRWAIG